MGLTFLHGAVNSAIDNTSNKGFMEKPNTNTIHRCTWSILKMISVDFKVFILHDCQFSVFNLLKLIHHTDYICFILCFSDFTTVYLRNVMAPVSIGLVDK